MENKEIVRDNGTMMVRVNDEWIEFMPESFLPETSFQTFIRNYFAPVPKYKNIGTCPNYSDAPIELPYQNGVIILINGCGGSGKDTFEDMVKGFLYGVVPLKIHHISTIDPLRNIAKEIVKINDPKSVLDKDSYRDCLADLKATWDKNYDGSFIYLTKKLAQIRLERDLKHVVFVHVREKENIERIVRDIHMESWSITTLCVYGRTDPSVFSNSSDRDVMSYHYDVYVNNSGNMDDLKNAAEAYADMLRTWLNV